MPPEVLTVEKRRWSGGSSVFIPVHHLRTDEWGTWVVAPPLTPHLHPGGWIEHVQASPIVGLIPHDRLFTAWFKPHGGKIDLSASNEVDFAKSTAVFVDVELDVVWGWDGAARVVDRDEFDELVLSHGLRADIEAEAMAVGREIDQGHGPFGVVARREVAAAVAAHGDAPLVRDGFAPVRPGLIPYVVAAFGASSIEASSAADYGWLLAAMCDDRVVGLARIADGRSAIVALADDLKGSPTEELFGQAAELVAGLPQPPS